MKVREPGIWEDDEYVYVPEQLFEHLPPEFRHAAETRKEQGLHVLRIADQDIKNLVRLANAVPTVMGLRYIFHRLRTSKFEITTEAMLEQEMLTTAFVVSYGRLFVSGNGGSGVSKSEIPKHLHAVHNEIIELRHQRYAHNGSHKTVGAGVEIDFDDDTFHVKLQMNIGFYLGGRNEWEELINALDALMFQRLEKTLARLKSKTGYEWTFPMGARPEWSLTPDT